jgi:DNA replication protein DnaC
VDSVREEFANASGAIDKLYDGIVLKCDKCQEGFLRDDKKVSSLSDLVSSSLIKCHCFRKYERLKSYVVSDIPREFWQMKETNFELEPQVQKQIDMYFEKLENAIEKGVGILFIGSSEGSAKPNSGVGKSALGTKALEYAIELGKTVHYATLQSYFNLLFRTMDESESKQRYVSLVDEIENVDVLCIDEVGKVKKSEFKYYRFEDMIRRRASKLLVTIIITNMNEGELQEFVGPSIMDILRHSMIRVQLVGESYRRKRFLDIKRQLKWEV